MIIFTGVTFLMGKYMHKKDFKKIIKLLFMCIHKVKG